MSVRVPQLTSFAYRCINILEKARQRKQISFYKMQFLTLLLEFYVKYYITHLLVDKRLYTSIVISWFYHLWQPLYPIDGLRERFCGLCVLYGTRFPHCNKQKR